ncbi:MAG: alkaline phosphatase family protein, partial [Deltaproteobacteria bacterium]|nr:alkaline phosphatase family protein [Deltaproteobacteria bacterium]
MPLQYLTFVGREDNHDQRAGHLAPASYTGRAWPKSLEDEIEALVGDYILDVGGPGENYLTMEKETVQEQCYAMDAQRFTLLKHFMGKRQCDCVITGVLGPEKMSHLFYRFFDGKHRQYSQDPQYSNVLHDYYVWIDQQIGDVRQALDDNTALFMFSDYGMQRLDGWVNLNEWLIQEGYLVLEEYPSEPVPFKELNVEWA